MNIHPHYYLMKEKKILRLEADQIFTTLSFDIRRNLFDPYEVVSLDQSQANWRVAIFRDEIMDLEEYIDWLNSPECLISQDHENDLTAN